MALYVWAATKEGVMLRWSEEFERNKQVGAFTAFYATAPFCKNARMPNELKQDYFKSIGMSMKKNAEEPTWDLSYENYEKLENMIKDAKLRGATKEGKAGDLGMLETM